jgi:DNA polymerase III subunit gamma/tau
MSYTALYRKFRPTDFNDVKGQDHIVTTLKNQMKADRIGHAYLFCGTRGTGKTTVAKILAKAVNCENPIDGNPCNECLVCQNINNQTSMNVIEIDAASNNGVDNIREIVEEVRYSPTEGRFKVYIIDEVHMLSTGAFNALLKTLEEPPSYVIFILATTEPQKIPITILSRCQRYDFKRITIDIIANRLKNLMDIEKVEVEEKALYYIARVADGSMRDALSLLDQSIAFYLGEKLTYDKVLDVLGAADVEVFSKLLNFILKQNVPDCIDLLDKLIIDGRELTRLTTEFTWYLRNLLLIYSSEKNLEKIDISSENISLLKEQVKLLDMDTLIRYIRIFSELSGQIKYASQKRVLVEVALIKLCTPQMEDNYDSLLDRIRLLEEKIEKGVQIHEVKNEESIEAFETIETPKGKIHEDEEFVKALPQDLKEVARNWNRITGGVSPYLRAILTNVRPSIGNDNTLLLIFTDEIELKVLSEEGHMQELKKAIVDSIQKDLEIQLKLIRNDKESLEAIPDLTKLIKNVKIEYED